MKKRGFTLVELLIVLLVIGILASIAVQNFGNLFDLARDNSAAYENRALQTQTGCRNVATANNQNPDTLCGAIQATP
ncbi:MAG: prepilin-type N-terminal cleavage/methylation domain-containing protein [Magnetococcales bacterium]|nr:prepilin-type N-terminal cleavage/methylation domain-containing protein [Magnetococcales bacterium]MBF0322514.1 prepilin-type N-terminal cleavage/methylation domain-containing protein [Magnetococcales bacterium]